MKRLQRHLRNLSLIFGALAALVAALLYSEGLFDWGFTLLQRSLPGTLTVESITGPLAGPIRIRGLQYEDEGRRVELATLDLTWRPSALLYNTLHITSLRLAGLDIETKGPAEETPATFTPPQFWLPASIVLDELELLQLSIAGTAGEPVVLDRIALAATMRWQTLELRDLALQSLQLGLAVTANGALQLRKTLPLQFNVDWSWQQDEEKKFVGNGLLVGDLQRLRLKQSITLPVEAHLDATLHQPLNTLTWMAHLTVPTLVSTDLPFPIEPPLSLRDGEIEAKGDTSGLNFTAGGFVTTELSGEVALKLAGDLDAERLDVTRLQLSLPGASGELWGKGGFTFADRSYVAQTSWQGIGWPIRGKRTITSKEGSASLSGKGERYRLSLDTQLQPAEMPDGRWRVTAMGNSQAIELEEIHGTTLEGTVDGNARVAWSPQITWSGEVQTRKLNPGVHWPEIPGAVDLTAKVQGSMVAGELALDGELQSLSGELRGQAVSGNASAAWKAETLEIGALSLRWGSATLAASGSAGNTLAINGRVSVDKLEELLPDGHGSMQSSIKLEGKRETPRLQLSLNGTGIGWESYRIERGNIKGDIDLADATPSSIHLALLGVQFAEEPFGTITLQGEGTMAEHRVELNVSDEAKRPLARGEWHGRYARGGWRGSIAQLGLSPKNHEWWRLREAVPMDISAEQVKVESLCLQQKSSQLCLGGNWQKTTGANASMQAVSVPLDLLAPLLPPRLAVSGSVDGHVNLGINPGVHLAADGKLLMKDSHLILFEEDGKHEQAEETIEQASLELATTEGAITAQATLQLGGEDRLGAALKLPLSNGWLQPAESQSLELRAGMALKNLDLVEVLVPELREVEGKITVTLNVDGTLQQPLTTGRIAVANGRCTIPRLGLELSAVALSAESTDGKRLALAATALSGGGTLRASGELHQEGEHSWAMNLKTAGDGFEVAHIPEARVKISPQLALHVEPLLVRIDGRLVIPEARVEPRDVSSAVTPSEDVVIVGDESAVQQERWRIYTNVEVEAPDSIRFIGYGFDGRIGGRVLLIDEPKRLTRARGELHVVAGSSYTALGQKLQTPQGRLIFADSPVDNPNLDIVAQREVGDVVAGVRVSGTAREPVLTLFSQPSMDEAEILAYLTLGHPLSSAGQSDGQTMMKAANTAGLAGGDYIAGYIGRQFGLEEARLESEGATEQPWLVIGKYLSPRLYIRYGTALLESGNSVLVRYQLSKRWFLEGESGRNSGGDIIYTFERP